MSFSDQQVMQQIQNTMLEPPDNGATWPSGMWTQAEVVDYLNQRQFRLLKDTHLQVGIALIPVVSGTIEYDLPDDWINTVRVVLVNTNGTTKELTRSDSWEADYGIPTWTYVAGTPKTYNDGDIPPLRIKLAPVPAANATLQVHYVPLSALLTGAGEIMTVPDEYVPYIKYGALSDMWAKAGRGHDPERASYCQKRYEMGIEITRMLLKGYKG